MSEDWTFDEFQIYVLLYASHCNTVETEEEYNYIISRFNFDSLIFNKMHTQITMDSEVERLNKIRDFIAYNNLTYQQKENLLRDIKNVFFADGTVDLIEKNVFVELKKILQI